MDTGADITVDVQDGPEACAVLEARLKDALADLIRWIWEERTGSSLRIFEKELWLRIALLYRLAVALFIGVQRERLDLQGWCAQGWRIKRWFAPRTVRTLCGAVSYRRAYLTRRQGGGWFPLDARLGITRDGFSWRVIDVVTRLSTRLSYASVQRMLQALIGWSPSPEAIEKLTIGLGHRAPAFMEAQGRLDGDGDVLVIEVDGKAAPMVTEAELAARRRPRQKEAGCKCQRHRSRQRRRKRQATKAMKRKKRGHNSKNGRSATLVAMYTLRRGADGKLHGPINKKIWGQFGTRQAALEWARAQATRRGFGPDTSRTVQIVIDGEKCLRKHLKRLFPRATITLDLRHAQERLWKVGRQFHEEGSAELERWVEPLIRLLLNGQINALLKQLGQLRASIPQRGPSTRAKRDVLDEQLAYFTERKPIMRYGEYRRADLVLATGVIEGACRYVVGERLDCSGMRWSPEGAEPVLQLRCIEVNGDWERFIGWATTKASQELGSGRRVQIRRRRPKPCAETKLKRVA
jgi:hypothetical protein